jgi:hypothetical protein
MMWMCSEVIKSERERIGTGSNTRVKIKEKEKKKKKLYNTARIEHRRRIRQK